MNINPFKLDATILREYDIRGIVGATLTPEAVRTVGAAFGSTVIKDGGGTVCVGYDGRIHSVELVTALIEGLVSTGVNVTNVGRGPTPMLYFATKILNADAGMMITGSHNPPEYNGIKMLMKKGGVFGEAIQALGKFAGLGGFSSGAGRVEEVDVRKQYVDRLVKDYSGKLPLKVVWDNGNGAAGEVLRMLVKKLPGEHTLMYDDIDGRFPNHHPDPTVEKNLADLKKKVAETGADLGIGFDGDADRIGAIDHLGRVVWGDQLLAIYAAEVLAEHPGATIISDVKASQTLFDEVARLGGRPLMWKTGHSLIKSKMIETNSPLAGEMSGHIFFADKYYGFDDALYCAVRLLGIVSRSGGSLATLRNRLPETFNTPEMRFQVDESRKFKVAAEVRDRLKADASAGEVNDIDGVRVRNADGWWLLRASNTQDVLVARAESTTPEGLERLKATLVEQLKQSGVEFNADVH